MMIGLEKTIKQYLVYKITCKISKKVYIGLTSKTIDQRFKEHIKDSKNGSNSKFHAAIRKHGSENFLFEILEENIESLEKAKEKEKYYISIFNSFYEGYNSTSGGDGTYIRTKEINEKRSSTLKELYKTGKIVSFFKDKDIHKKTIEKRESNGTNVRKTNNPMWDPEKVAKKVEKTSGENHYLVKRNKENYKFFIVSPDGNKSILEIEENLPNTLKKIGLSKSTFYKLLNTDKPCKSGPWKDYKFLKLEIENENN